MWRPGSNTPFAVDIREDGEVGYVSADFAHVAVQRKALPISKFERLILYSVEHYRVTVLVGETGCGKSTQIPQFLYPYWCHDGYGVVITQPRRLAAINLAQRVQMEMNDKSNVVGYRVRYDDQTTPGVTAIHYVTDGTLVREASFRDPLLSNYSVIIVDECHERTIHTDILLGLLKKLLQQRPHDLRIILCSATVDAQSILDFFKTNHQTTTKTAKKRKSRWDNNKDLDHDTSKQLQLEEGTILSVDGRQYPVEIFYAEKPVSDYIVSTVDTAFRIYNQQQHQKSLRQERHTNTGDILCFLPSEKDIHKAISMMEELLQEQAYQQHVQKYKHHHHHQQQQQQVECLPLYGSLSPKSQQKIFKSSTDVQKIIFATNIAETSVTIPNITTVIDCGYVKLPYFDPISGLDRLIITPISQASAQQRSGRAGRVRPGKCYRLYTQESMNQVMDKMTQPSVLRTNLTSFVLTLKALGIHNVLTFDFITMPNVAAFSHALEKLYLLGLISKDTTDLTILGHKLADFPTDPRVSKMMYESLAFQCSHQVLCVAASLQIQSSLWLPLSPSAKEGTKAYFDYVASSQEVAHDSGDHMTAVNIMDHFHKYYQNNRIDDDGKFLHLRAIRRAWEVHSQLSKCLGRYGSIQRHVQNDDNQNCDEEEKAGQVIRRCIAAGFFGNAAKLANDGHYYTLKGKHKVQVSNNSMLTIQSQQQYVTHNFSDHSSNSKDYVLFCESVDGTNYDGLEIRSCSYIQGKWLKEVAPDYFL